MLLEGDPQALERAVARSDLKLEGQHRSTERESSADEIGGIEAVIGPSSILVGQSAGRLALHTRFDVNLLAVSRSGIRFTERLRDIVLQAGDLLVLKGNLARLPDKLRELGACRWPSEIRLGNVREAVVPIAILGGAMALTAFGVLPSPRPSSQPPSLWFSSERSPSARPMELSIGPSW